MSDSGRSDPHADLTSKLMSGTPTIVKVVAGTFLTIAIAVVIVMKMGGFEPVIMRIANAYAEGIEVQMRQLEKETTKLATINASLEVVLDKLVTIEQRISSIEQVSRVVTEQVTANSKEIAGHGVKLGELDDRITKLNRWACEHVDAVKTRPVAPNCPPN